jgi:hypothetical protein
MLLRKHSLMSYRGHAMWPPIWVYGLGAKTEKQPRGEVGLLKEVRYYATKPGRLFLTIDHEGEEYTGCLLLDDDQFCAKLAELLKNHYGARLDDIGSLDIPAPEPQ